MTETAQPDEHMTMAQWARWMGWKSAGMAYQAKKEGRLVFADDGRHVLADASKARYEATADPAAAAVTARHAADAPAPEPAPDYQDARARKMHYEALMAGMQYDEECRRLLRTDDVRAELNRAGVEIRAALERLPYLLAATITPSMSEPERHAAVAAQVETVLAEMSAAFARVTQ